MVLSTLLCVFVTGSFLFTSSSAALCSKTVSVANNRGQFWACLDGRCITLHISYSGISRNPFLTICKYRKADGSECYRTSSQNICSDISLSTRLGVPDPDRNKYIYVYTGFRPSPAKVCFQNPLNICSGSAPTSPPTANTPPPTQPTNPSQLLTQSDRYEIVREHNKYRRLTTPSAANMKLMVYSNALEQYAQSYLNRVSGCPLAHNPNNNRFGENVYKSSSYGQAAQNINYPHVVTLWHDEKNWFNYYSRICNAPPNHSCGHFTQVVWDSSEKVGCGMKRCVSQGWTQTVVLCNYDPPGNSRPYGSLTIRQPFTLGPKCSHCPSGYTRCNNGLCYKSSLTAMAQSNDMDAIVLDDEEAMAEEVGIPLSREDGAENEDVSATKTRGMSEMADWVVSVEAVVMDKDQESKKPRKYEAVDEVPKVKVIEDNAGYEFQPGYD